MHICSGCNAEFGKKSNLERHSTVSCPFRKRKICVKFTKKTIKKDLIIQVASDVRSIKTDYELMKKDIHTLLHKNNKYMEYAIKNLQDLLCK